MACSLDYTWEQMYHKFDFFVSPAIMHKSLPDVGMGAREIAR